MVEQGAQSPHHTPSSSHINSSACTDGGPVVSFRPPKPVWFQTEEGPVLASATSSSSGGTPLRAPLYQRTESAPILKVSTGRVVEQCLELSRPEQSNLPTIIDLYVPSRARVVLAAYEGRAHTQLTKGVGEARRGSSLSRTKVGHTQSSRRGSGRSSPKALVLPYAGKGPQSLSGRDRAGGPCFLRGAPS